MEKNYRCFGYRITYSCDIVTEKYRKQDKYEKNVCFAHVFNYLQYDYNRSKEFTGTYTIECKKEFEECSGNYCSLNTQEIKKVLQYMHNAFKIKTKLQETDSLYIITMEVYGKIPKHLFMLSFSRVFFEHPYNEIAKDVFRIKALKQIDGIDISHISFLKLYHDLGVCTDHFYGYGHSLFSRITSDLTKKELESGFNKYRNGVNDVFTTHMTPKNLKKFDSCKTDWDNGFPERFETVYVKNFKILRDERQKDLRRRRRDRVRKMDK